MFRKLTWAEWLLIAATAAVLSAAVFLATAYDGPMRLGG